MFRGLKVLLDGVRSRYGPRTQVMLLLVYSTLARYLISSFRSSVLVRYVYDRDTTFADAILAVRWRDFSPWNEPSDPADDGLTPDQLAALQRLFAALRGDSEPLLETLSELAVATSGDV